MKKYLHLFACISVSACFSATTSSAQIEYYKDSVQASILDTSALPQALVNGIVVTNNVVANQVFTTYNVNAAIQRYPTASAAYLRQVYLIICQCNEAALKTELEAHPDIFAGVQLIQKPQVLDVNNLTAGANDITIYPNPFADHIRINAGSVIRSVRITDMNGRVVLSQLKPAADIDLHSLPAGNYLLSTTSADGITTRTITKQ